ncbi:hypothetical protein [Allokutzneria oryzae]|uniref:PhoD-like phosphatase metallophosphatase domain-containing protein n=1 Tax=Allokutzneria oryzae TaxID=1378989 RepID=A0ABV5ZP51_9PSEU
MGRRDRITRGWGGCQVPNPVVLTGDVHRHRAACMKANPSLRFVSDRRGYVHATVTPEKMTARYFDPAEVTRGVARTHVVNDGRPGLVTG